MENFETAKRLRKTIQELQTEDLATEILERERAQPRLDSERLKAEMLKKSGWEEKIRAAEENRERVKELKERQAKREEKIKILEQELKSIELKALKDIREYYRPRVEKALKELAIRLKEAAKYERELKEIKEEVDSKLREITHLPYVVILPIRHVLLAKDGEPEANSPLNFFLRECRDYAGIEVETEG